MNISEENIFANLGIEELNALQKKSLDEFEKGQDMLILSPTGSGKTIAFLLPLVKSINIENENLQAVIITPSRELALQIDGVLRQMKSGVRSMSCYGGRPAMEEHRQMNGLKPHVLIATPGRLVDHLQKNNISVSSCRYLVIDEYDKCLEFGFEQEMKSAISLLPSEVQTVMCSATRAIKVKMPVVLDFLSDEADVEKRISLYVVNSPVKDKLDTLLCLLRCFKQESTIVFLNYREAVERTFHFLREAGVECVMFHGAMLQERRERSIFKFSNGSSNVLVCTDLGARGLDFPEIDNIVHYHLPLDEEAYVHRNGRTARWESHGNSYMILNEDEVVPEYVLDCLGDVPEFYIPSRLPELRPSLWATLYIGKGKRNRISKSDILGMLCKTGGLSSQDVGTIEIREHQSFAVVRRSRLSELLKKLEGQKIKGIKTIFSEAK